MVAINFVRFVCNEYQGPLYILSELVTFEWWILGLMLDPLFSLIARLNNACSSLVIYL